jgi:hypothetical protein
MYVQYESHEMTAIVDVGLDAKKDVPLDVATDGGANLDELHERHPPAKGVRTPRTNYVYIH